MRTTVLLLIFAAIVSLTGCSGAKMTKSAAYKGIYDEKPVTVLLMPPINRTTEVEAKDYFHLTLNVPIVDAGYYVIPPFLSMEILKKESAYDAELFLNSSLQKFGEVFGADLVLFTVINRWDKQKLVAKVDVEIEYIFKSVKTGEIVYSRKGRVTYDASVNTGVGGGFGLLANIAAGAINTAVTKYVDVARACNAYTFKDLPAGKYNPAYERDGEEIAGQKEFKVSLNSKYR
ncbi:MAG: DUF799 domain-containing protein [Odoribacteraceae bacterium]|jgi:hypothetical protein|nr:DUF799 domain-containing protein [Odoribacteraceae bacterium]